MGQYQHRFVAGTDTSSRDCPRRMEGEMSEFVEKAIANAKRRVTLLERERDIEKVKMDTRIEDAKNELYRLEELLDQIRKQ